MNEDRPEWADDMDDDEAPVADIVPEEDDDVDDGELDEVALNTPVNLAIETAEGDAR